MLSKITALLSLSAALVSFSACQTTGPTTPTIQVSHCLGEVQKFMDLRQAHEQSTFKADEGGVIVAGIGSEAEGKLRLMLFVIPLELTIGNKALEEGADQKVVDCKLPTGRDAKAIFYLNPQMAE